MATLMAANSDSTLMYWQVPSSPLRTILLSASTMWVWGVIGYAQITSGRLSAMASALALPAALLWRSAGAVQAPLAMEAASSLVGLATLVAAVAVLWLVPQTWLMLWGAARLDPGLVSILFLSEVVVAALSAGLLIDEAFGAREIAGCGLIVAAGLLASRDEVRGNL